MSIHKDAIISSIFDVVDQVSAHLVADTYHHLAVALAPTMYLFCTLAVGLLFLAAMRGLTTYHDMVMASFKLVAMLTLALNYDYFCLFIYNIFTQEPLYLFQVIALHSPTGNMTINQALDVYLNLGMQYSNKLFMQGGWSNWSFLLFAGLVCLFTLAASCIAAGLILLAKIASTVLLALSPIFLFCASFKATYNIFNAFISHLITYALIPLLACIVLMITFSVTDQIVGYINSYPKASLAAVFPFLLTCLIQIYLLMHVHPKASALAGGFNLASFMSTLRNVGQEAKHALSAATGGQIGRSIVYGGVAGAALGIKSSGAFLYQRMKRFKKS